MASSQPDNLSVGYMMPLSLNEAACVIVSPDGVALMSPAIPVKEGQVVPLHCKTDSSASNIQATFFRNGTVISDGATDRVTIHNFSASAEGPYWCKTNERESPHVWLLLEGKYLDPASVSLAVCLRFGYLGLGYLFIWIKDLH